MKTIQRTFAIVKPDAVEKNVTGEIISMIEKNGFRIIGAKMLHINKAQAEGFYAVHVGKPFFNSLTDFMSRGPIVVMALEKDNAIADWRKLMGATNIREVLVSAAAEAFAACSASRHTRRRLPLQICAIWASLKPRRRSPAVTLRVSTASLQPRSAPPPSKSEAMPT